MSLYVEWRALIGPRFDHYQWWVQLTYGDDEHILDMSTTLTSTLAAAGTVVNVVSTGGGSPLDDFPSVGGLWIGPNNTGEAWEYVQYQSKTSTTFTSITKEPSTVREHSGIHTSGAEVRQWYVADTALGELSFTESLDATFTALTWQAQIRGVAFPQWALRNNHLCVIQTRTGPTADWAIQLVGVLDNPTVSDNYLGHAEWNVNIRSIEHAYGKTQIRGIRVGGFEIARYANIQGSTPLVMAVDERDSGEWTAAEPTFEPQKAADNDPSTLWIGERFIGSPNTIVFPNADTRNTGDLKFSQLYLNPHPEMPSGARWIELALMQGELVGYWIASANGSGAGSAITLKLPTDNSIESSGRKIIIAENVSVFRRLNPLAEPELLIDISETAEYAGGNPDFFDHLTATGGDMWIFNTDDEFADWHGRVAWGDGHWGGGSNWPQYSGSPTIPTTAYGTTITAPTAGQTIRYIHVTSGSLINGYWQVGKIKCAGYEIDDTTGVWLMLSFNGMGLKLLEGIEADNPDTGETLLLTTDGGASSAGLPATGTLWIAGEQITYSAKNDFGVVVTARAANSTVAAIHDAGDPVYLMFESAPTDAQLFTSLAWDRYLGTGAPEEFKVWRSSAATVRTPDDDGWEDDWTLVSEYDDYSDSDWLHTFGTSVRIRHVLLRIERMSVDPMRAKINEMRATLDPSVHYSTLWFANGADAFDVIEMALVQAGIAGAAVDHSGTSPTISETTTADADAWAVAVDIARYCGCQIIVERDSKITLRPNTLWTSTPTIGYTWDETNLGAIDITWTNGVGVSQVKVNWRSFDASEFGVEVYPAAEQPPGTVLEIDEARYTNASVAQAAAERIYIVNRYPTTIQITSADGLVTYRPGGIAEVNWQFHPDMQEIDRQILVKNTQHRIKDNQWYTTADHQQVEREAEN